MTVWIVLVHFSGPLIPTNDLDLYMNAVFSSQAACEKFIHRVEWHQGVPPQKLYCHPEKVED